MIAHSLRPARLSVTRPMQRAIMTGGALVATVLAAPTRTTEADVQAFRFSNDSRYLAIEKQRADTDAKHTGHDGVLRTLATGLTRNLGNVAAFAFNEAGTRLAWLLDAADRAGNGVYLMDPASGSSVAGRVGPVGRCVGGGGGGDGGGEGVGVAISNRRRLWRNRDSTPGRAADSFPALSCCV